MKLSEALYELSNLCNPVLCASNFNLSRNDGSVILYPWKAIAKLDNFPSTYQAFHEEPTAAEHSLVQQLHLELIAYQLECGDLTELELMGYKI